MMPAYGGACLSSLAPALLAAPKERPDWLPAPLREASQVVLLVVDGLGWLQLQSRAHLAPVMAGFGRRADHFGSPDNDGNGANLARSRDDTCRARDPRLQVPCGRPERQGSAQCPALEHDFR